MSITLFHHPLTRAATVVWMLEEVGVPYTLRYVDIMAGAQKGSDFLALNPMGKLPTLVDGDVVLAETSAIGLYLADRYSHGKLAPTLEDPARAAYFRWSVYAPSVIEPGAMAHAANWSFRAANAGWGDYATMLTTMETAIGAGPWLLGERFSMADVIFGGTLRFMLQFNMVEARPAFTDYAARLMARPAFIAAAAKNQAVLDAHPPR